jgi:phage major head subunit gpT-like protein
MAISEQWAELLEPGLRAVFVEQQQALAAESKVPLLFNQINSSKAAEHFLGAGGLSDFQEYKGVIEYEDFDQLYKTTLTNQEYVKAFKVERKLVDDDQYNIITPRPKQLAMAAMRTREKHAASIFNNAFSASYVGGDNIRLCNASHPLAPTHAGDVQGNAGTSALSYATLNATRQLMRAFTDDRKELTTIVPDTLLVPPELEEAAYAIAKTVNKPDTADYHANFAGGWLKNVVVWDYLTDANNWFLIDQRMAKIHLLWIDRVPLEFAMDPTSDFSLEARFRGYMRYSYGWSDYRWVYGQAVT